MDINEFASLDFETGSYGSRHGQEIITVGVLISIALPLIH